MKSDAHIHSMFFAPMLDHAHETMGAEDVARVLADAGTSEAELRDPRAWFSSELTDRIADAFVEVSGNTVTILSDIAVPADRIDAAEAQAAVDAAGDDLDELRWAKAQLRVATGDFG